MGTSQANNACCHSHAAAPQLAELADRGPGHTNTPNPNPSCTFEVGLLWQVARMVRWLMAPNPDDRPSAREVLRSELLPPTVGDEQLTDLLRSLPDKSARPPSSALNSLPSPLCLQLPAFNSSPSPFLLHPSATTPLHPPPGFTLYLHPLHHFSASTLPAPTHLRHRSAVTPLPSTPCLHSSPVHPVPGPRMITSGARQSSSAAVSSI